MFKADLLSSLKRSQIHLSLPYVKMSHYGFKIQDENWSFRRSLPVEKFSNLSFLKSEALVHLKSCLLWEAVPSEWLPQDGMIPGKNGASVHKDPGQSGWRMSYGGPWVVPGALCRGLDLVNVCVWGVSLSQLWSWAPEPKARTCVSLAHLLFQLGKTSASPQILIYFFSFLCE